MYDNYIELSDIKEEYHDIIEEIGFEAFIKLVNVCQGQHLYIPKLESITRNSRDRKIQNEYTGGNYKQLARKYGLTERRIRDILNTKYLLH